MEERLPCRSGDLNQPLALIHTLTGNSYRSRSDSLNGDGQGAPWCGILPLVSKTGTVSSVIGCVVISEGL